jgi:hypothetical protein
MKVNSGPTATMDKTLMYTYDMRFKVYHVTPQDQIMFKRGVCVCVYFAKDQMVRRYIQKE